MYLLPRVGRSVGRHGRFLSQSTSSLTSQAQTPSLPLVATSHELRLTKAVVLTSGESLLGKGFRTCAVSLSDKVSVEVPQMGDSITEGSVASIIGAGTHVEMDDVIAQIETDKVTLDVRAPVSGTLEAVKVQEGDTVLVGQVLGEMKGGQAPVAAARSSASETSPTTPSPSRDGQGISFPVRRSPAGERISSMAIGKAQKNVAELQGTPRPRPTVENYPRTVPGPGKEQRKNDTFASWLPAQRGFKRRVLLNSEMEAIMLGGADP